jgi:hypothetical protein
MLSRKFGLSGVLLPTLSLDLRRKNSYKTGRFLSNRGYMKRFISLLLMGFVFSAMAWASPSQAKLTRVKHPRVGHHHAHKAAKHHAHKTHRHRAV